MADLMTVDADVSHFGDRRESFESYGKEDGIPFDALRTSRQSWNMRISRLSKRGFSGGP